MAEKRIARARNIDAFMTAVFYAIAIFFFTLLAAFAGKVIIGGLMGATPEMFRFARKGSIGNQLFNTVYLVFISLAVSVPLGVCAGIYLAMYAKEGPVTKFLRMCIETLSSLPSIVVGLFGYLVFLVFFGMGKSLMAGALSVSILTLPLITTTTEDALKGLPAGYYHASLGLGATRWQSIFHVLLPACLPRIMTGVILAAGRGPSLHYRIWYLIKVGQLESVCAHLSLKPLPPGGNSVYPDLESPGKRTGQGPGQLRLRRADAVSAGVQHWR